MRTLVCGGRGYGLTSDERAFIFAHLDALVPPATFVIAGGARGADSVAVEWARARGIPSEVYRADWNKHQNAAGPIRNTEMLVEGKPDRVVAFPGGKGTADMLKKARAKGVPCTTPGAVQRGLFG